MRTSGAQPPSRRCLTANRLHGPGTPLRSWLPRSSNSIPDPMTRSFTTLDTKISPGAARRVDAGGDVHGQSSEVVTVNLALAGVQTGAELDAECAGRLEDRHRALDRSAGPSNDITKPSPVVLISRPRKRASCSRTARS